MSTELPHVSENGIVELCYKPTEENVCIYNEEYIYSAYIFTITLG